MIEVYAIADRDDAELPAGLARVTHGELAGVYSRLEERTERVTAEALWRHEAVVESLMADRALLPLRYGTVLPDERALAQLLADRAEEFSRLLEAVRGRVEVALRVLDGAGGPAPERESSGRAYMESLARRRRRGEHAAALIKPLEGIADAAHRRESAGDDLSRWSFLVDRGCLDEFNARLDELRSSHPELSMTCTGPWPPYSFVSGGR